MVDLSISSCCSSKHVPGRDKAKHVCVTSLTLNIFQFCFYFMDSFAFTPNMYGGNIEMYCSKLFITFEICANMFVNSIRILLPYSNEKKIL
jgi:hypothetical protein